MKSTLFAPKSPAQTGPSASRDQAAAREAARLKLMREDEGAVERENDAILNALADDATILRRVAGQMRDDVKEHNTFLDMLASRFTGATGGVRLQSGRLDDVMKQYGFKHTMYIAVGIVVAVILLYYIGSWVASARSAGNAAAPEGTHG